MPENDIGPDLPPEQQVARNFMTDKGYPDLEPVDIEHEERFLWIFTYELPEGELDLRVEWLADKQEWDAGVDDFRLN